MHVARILSDTELSRKRDTKFSSSRGLFMHVFVYSLFIPDQCCVRAVSKNGDLSISASAWTAIYRTMSNYMKKDMVHLHITDYFSYLPFGIFGHKPTFLL